QLQELLDIQMPCFQVGTDSTLTLPPLVDGNSGIVYDLEKRHDTLALSVGATDVRSQGAHRSPVISQTTAVFRQQRILLDGIVNACQIIAHSSEKAGG